MFDVVIVGARCAGSPLAILLARRGLRVCLVDKANFPHETPSTHVIQPCGVRILAELGVLESVLATGAVPLDWFTMVNDDDRIDASIDLDEFGAPGLCVRRLTLDALLVEAAAAAGADVRTGCRVTGLLTEPGGRVAGVCTDGGDIPARLVVGADGRKSTVAALVGATEYLKTPPGRTPAWAYFAGVGDRTGRLLLGRTGDLAFLASPTDGGLYMAGIGIDVARAPEFHAAREAFFAKSLAQCPELPALLDGADRVGPIRVMTDWHGYFRCSAGPGWVLVGDAGHFKDFTTAQGISDAFRQARALAQAIAADGGALDARLTDWWHWRDRDAFEMYWLAADMGLPGAASPLVARLLRSIGEDPAATRLFLKVLNHDVRPAQLFTARRVLAAAAWALVERPDRLAATSREIGAGIRNEIYRARARRRLASK
ncbi:FAD-dependent monooxygenase [Skermania sp. ID1734]|uniref:FAD-dependent oxidoreductase n=1 Tax=Skermania sp. ID1734 TaxID=2597516 RepID=UPI00117ECDC8|nr:NAD(P)/FAD-dependent oxidoreductase [Skermania sp. ID1734]TSD99763.1 FAD-dependent monooxygenase [Skermania sp. ID1734]